MTDLIQLAIYNPAILKDDDFLAGYVARQEVVTDMINRLRQITPTSLAKHQLILGQRGMGKTSLLRRTAIAINQDDALNTLLLPLTFREEQYNVHNLYTFWCNCLDALADHFERSQQLDKAEALDKQIAELTRSKRPAASEDEGDDALALLKTWSKQEGKRVLLLIDNIDLILDGISKQHWALRRTLQEAGGIIMLGASTAYLEATTNPKEAFYDFFQITTLTRLSHQELLTCLRRLAEARGETGKRVQHIINTDPGRINTLHDLTGGNLRTLTLLYLLLERDADDEVMGDLEQLLDQVTALYKARVEDLAPQARVVLDAVALYWNPVTAAKLAEITGMETSAVSAQLDRLSRNGLIEKTKISSSARAAFQLGERFFNIWYLMRHGPRRQRSRLRWLTGFLRGFYTPEQLVEKAQNLLKTPTSQSQGHYCLALSEAIEQQDIKNLLIQQAKQDFEKLAISKGKRLEEIVDIRDLPTPKTANEWFGMGWWLDEFSRYEEAESAYIKAAEFDETNHILWANLASIQHINLKKFKEAELNYRKSLSINANNADIWNNLGVLIQDSDIGTAEQAEEAFRNALKIDPKYEYSLSNLGVLLQDHFGKYEEAESIYRKTLEINPNNSSVWNNLGNLYQNYLNKYNEAETAYREAANRDPSNPYPLANLANLLQTHLAKYDEAEMFYRKAVEINSKNTNAWNGLGSLLQDHTDEIEESVQAYLRCIESDPEYPYVYANLAYLLIPTKPDEAEPYYQQALNILPQHGADLLRGYAALARDNFGEATNALNAALDTKDQELLTVYLDDLLRILRLAAKKQYGDKLLEWLDESGLADHYWPIYVAYDAYLHGEEILGDVNPEVGTAAKRIYQWLVSKKA